MDQTLCRMMSVFMFKDFSRNINFFFLFKALSVPSSGGDSWTKQVSYTGSEPNSEVLTLNWQMFVIEQYQTAYY